MLLNDGVNPAKSRDSQRLAEKAMDAAIRDVYAPMAFAQPAKKGIINRRSELKTG